jgi:hypothetical protein
MHRTKEFNARVREYGACDPADIVIQRAETRLNENSYNLFGNNCYHFAAWCKTGKKESAQVKDAVSAGGGPLGPAPPSLAVWVL